MFFYNFYFIFTITVGGGLLLCLLFLFYKKKMLKLRDLPKVFRSRCIVIKDLGLPLHSYSSDQCCTEGKGNAKNYGKMYF